MFDLLTRIKTLINPPRPEAKTHCDVCGTYVGSTGGTWTGSSVLCSSRQCADTDQAHSAW